MGPEMSIVDILQRISMWLNTIIDRVVPQLSLIRSEIAMLQMLKTPYLSQKKTSQRELEDAHLSSLTYHFHLSPHAPVIYLFL